MDHLKQLCDRKLAIISNNYSFEFLWSKISISSFTWRLQLIGRASQDRELRIKDFGNIFVNIGTFFNEYQLIF